MAPPSVGRVARLLLSAAGGLALVVSVTTVAERPDSPRLEPAAVQAVEPILPGSTEEHMQAWEDLPESDKQEALGFFEDHIAPMVEQQVAALPPEEAPLSPIGTGYASPVVLAGDEDLDGDGLGQQFEDQLANLFMPLYHVSAGEAPGTGFTRFADEVDQRPIGPARLIPPLVHVRVTPFGVGGGLGHVRIDYLTLWNRDDGYVSNPVCDIGTAFIGRLAGFGHALDNERSATIVAAPLVTLDDEASYNADPLTYQAVEQFTVAHENDRFGNYQQRRRLSPPVPADQNAHAALQLWLSQSKHGTYHFNPDGRIVINLTFQILFRAAVVAAFLIFDDFFRARPLLLITIPLVLEVFLDVCIAESFREQGTSLPSDPINVGEVDRTLNGSSFINGGNLRGKLLGPPRPSPDLTPPTAPDVQVDQTTYVVGESPFYRVKGQPNSKIYWSSARDGASTGEVNAYYGHRTDANGNWSGYGSAWQGSDLGLWTKRVRVGGMTAQTSFNVARVRLTTDKRLYRAAQSPFYRVKGPPNTPILWTSILNGELVEQDAYLGDSTDANGNWSGYGEPWLNQDAGLWTKKVRLGTDVASTTLRVIPVREQYP